MRGQGRLGAERSFNAFTGQEPFLDGHVYVLPPKPGRDYELLVLGDLHGCYSCLKAALLQADFAKVEAYRADPVKNPEMMLVFLGDYIDRGRFSYDGILRTVLRLFLAAPEHVFVLRGNHEHYYIKDGAVASPVRPAEAIGSIAATAPRELLDAYMRLFEVLPNVAGVRPHPLRARAASRGTTPSSRSSAPWPASTIPRCGCRCCGATPATPSSSPSSSSGRTPASPTGGSSSAGSCDQIGCSLMVRGHERVVEWPAPRLRRPRRRAAPSLFSAGGAQNQDLLADSNYREVTPMALTIRHQDGLSRITPAPDRLRAVQRSAAQRVLRVTAPRP